MTAVLVAVDQVGAACHTGDRTCFDAGATWRRRRSAGPMTGIDASSGVPADGVVVPDRDTFLADIAEQRVVPVTRRCSPTPRPRSASTASSPPGRVGHVPARVRRARRGRGRASPSSGSASAATLSERDGDAVWTGIGPGRPPGRSARRAARRGGAAAAPAAAGAAAADRRLRRLPRLRRRSADRAAARRWPTTTSACPSCTCCSPPTSPCSTTTSARSC